MNWDEKLIEACTETDGRVHPHTDHVIAGAHWQRYQLRTDEAVERVARAINPAAWDSATPSWDMRPALRGDARRAIDALLGEDA